MCEKAGNIFKIKNYISMTNKLKIMAVDPSLTASGFALMAEDEVKAVYELKPKAEGDARLGEIAKIVYGLLIKWQPDILAIETQYIAVRSSSVLRVVEVKGIIEGVYLADCCLQGKKPIIIEVAPTEARKSLGMAGRLNRKEGKLEIKSRIMEKFPFIRGFAQDIYDAVAIGLTARKKYDLNQILFNNF